MNLLCQCALLVVQSRYSHAWHYAHHEVLLLSTELEMVRSLIAVVEEVSLSSVDVY